MISGRSSSSITPARDRNEIEPIDDPLDVDTGSDLVDVQSVDDRVHDPRGPTIESMSMLATTSSRSTRSSTSFGEVEAIDHGIDEVRHERVRERIR